MIVKPKIREFVCTTAHPIGCEESVRLQAEYATKNPVKSPKRVLVIGSSGGYGLATRIMACFGGKADTIGVHFDKEPTASKTGTSGFYTTRAFDKLAQNEGRISYSINSDAFSQKTKIKTVEAIRTIFGGQVDCVIYSLAAPRKKDELTGRIYNSVIKPIGKFFEEKTVDINTGKVSIVKVEPATNIEIEETVAVMGGSDWNNWIDLLLQNNVLAQGACTLAFSYIGPEQTHAIYTNGTMGRAKLDLENTANQLCGKMSCINGRAFVSVNKALVTQASSAIPVVPLYIALLYKVMKESDLHEDCIEQAHRLFKRFYGDYNGDWVHVQTDEKGRIRLDDLEMSEDIQAKIKKLWNDISSDNIFECADIQGFRISFLQIFGFNIPGIDYESDIDIV
ncbi:MAG: enoyl-ACP reductase FabV [Lachnospiraceae bacterium]